ncbi:MULTISPECIES: hypothetical protein [unclassified Mesorhizobium]|uniref:hypothetical protein n=1 Tax=unclassified Mesorhizobium TaxID=325217 RepID=UPI001091A3FB|nr:MULTISPECIES: hypothetical protein [unclassified Mesorhizobium]TGP93819.1 hypothetical protein EN861_17160 [Mesorhizobium sp. M8A.F.Ca.ET.218.01.1.1]TGT18116.1 hypothetical protein EN856_16690 [Mesorhizobium sp. M8A.F.Ca.ET.213.01.1.1]
MLSNETAGLEEVAAALGRKPSWLKRRWLRLHLEQGFPRKISTGDVWPRRAVEVWLRSGGVVAPQPLPANQNEGAADLVANAAAALRARYNGVNT